MHPGPQIRRIRQAREWKLEDLAQAVERELGKPINTGNLSRLEREGQGYSNELLQAIARALDVPIARFFEASEPEGLMVVTMTDRAAVTYSIPLLEIGGSMGRGRVQPEFETIVGRLEVNRAWVQANLPQISGPANLRVITGYGDSMEGTFNDGDVLFVDTGVKEVRVDAVYVFALNEDLYIKRLQRRPDGSVTIISDNKKYEPYVVTQREQFSIMGRVVWAWNGKRL
jgi:phage repressor protein C with HTH and peptisase S24 domain